MRVKFKKLVPEAKIPFKKYDSDFCYDMYATSIDDLGNGVYRYHTGIGLQIERGKFLIGKIEDTEVSLNFADMRNRLLLDIDGRPRSSIYKTGMVLSNCEATIDEDYINEICFIFYHVIPTLPKYEVGDRIAQIKIGFTVPCEFIEADELEERTRGMNGFGSSGNK